jgi:transcriptional regulator with XRE-family HTH domain
MRVPQFDRLVAEERLILEATELISERMETAGVTRAELAERIGTTRSHVTQLLAGNRNMTLRTLADVGFALGFEVRLAAVPVGAPAALPVRAAPTVSDVVVPWWGSAMNVVEPVNTLSAWPAMLPGASVQFGWRSDDLYSLAWDGATSWFKLSGEGNRQDEPVNRQAVANVIQLPSRPAA